MRCATCESVVQDFKLLAPLVLKATAEKKTSDTSSISALLPSFFDECKVNERKKNRYETLALSNVEPAFATQKNSRQSSGSTDFAVLRIDNVPWVSN